MAKLFLTTLPSEEDLSKSLNPYVQEGDSASIYSHILLRRVTTDLEINLDAFFTQFHLSTGRFTLMMILRENAAGLMPSELSQRVGVTQATISGLISSLEKAELVHRETHAKDGRAYVIKLTEKGQELVKKITPEYFRRVEAFWSHFNGDEKKQLNGFFERMLKDINAIGVPVK
jgi:DNA-binding MarR family transcriptional regulator